MADNPTWEICERVAEVQALLDEHRLRAADSEDLADLLQVGRYQYAGVVSRHNPVGDWVLFPFPPRAVHDDGGLAGEACSMIEHRPLTSRRGIPSRYVRDIPRPPNSTSRDD
jgi:hypothetical protein